MSLIEVSLREDSGESFAGVHLQLFVVAAATALFPVCAVPREGFIVRRSLAETVF